MKLIAANQAATEQVEKFLGTNEHVDKQLLYKNGFVVELNNQIEGCFILEDVNNGVYWLKQLHVTKHAAASLPVLLEAILVMAKKRNARSVYVHSYQPMVDILLKALQFYPQKSSEFVDKYPIEKGSWWTYNVS